ncbi:MAG: hypothetical protein ACRC7H_07540 [Plesiomonas shigelloides]
MSLISSKAGRKTTVHNVAFSVHMLLDFHLTLFLVGFRNATDNHRVQFQIVFGIFLSLLAVNTPLQCKNKNYSQHIYMSINS